MSGNHSLPCSLAPIASLLLQSLDCDLLVDSRRVSAALSYEVTEQLGGKNVEDMDPVELKSELLKVRISGCSTRLFDVKLLSFLAVCVIEIMTVQAHSTVKLMYCNHFCDLRCRPAERERILSLPRMHAFAFSPASLRLQKTSECIWMHFLCRP